MNNVNISQLREQHYSVGNLSTKTDAKGQVTTYSYDKLNRLVEVDYAPDTDGGVGKSEIFGYDERGLLTSYSGDVSGTLAYDALGRKLSETVNYGTFTKTFSYTYDKLGNKASFTNPDGTQYNYSYTDLHQPESISWGSSAIVYSYQWDRLISQALPNGVNTDYTYNANNWLTGLTAKRADASTVMDYNYNSFDNVGNILGKVTEAGTHSYGYDELYRLTSAQNPLLPAAETFSYDKVGNRTTSADATGWNYNANNALVGYNGFNYTYDPNGNTISKSASGQVTAFAYNAKDRLEQVNLPDGKIAIYKYDPFGRRISKTVDGAVTYFMYADEGLVAEMSAAGAVVKSYGWMPDGTWGTDPVLMKEGSQTYYYHNDHLGTPQKMTDSTGAVVWSATYTAFGEAAVDASSSVTNNLRYPGQYFDAESGLHYNFFRYYNPITGRYNSLDDIHSNNRYIYAKDNTLIYIDNFGLWCKTIGPLPISRHFSNIDYDRPDPYWYDNPTSLKGAAFKKTHIPSPFPKDYFKPKMQTRFVYTWADITYTYVTVTICVEKCKITYKKEYSKSTHRDWIQRHKEMRFITPDLDGNKVITQFEIPFFNK